MSECYLARQSASRHQPLVGVNLGGWLVLERWMTPGLFAGTEANDEYEFMQTPGARSKLRRHQREFITEEDWRWLAEHHIDAVRIPIGYWILDGDGPLRPAIGRLDWAVRMAKKYQIRVLLCLHGAPGSQNGNDHSGRRGDIGWHKSDEYQQRTIDVLTRLASRYREKPAVWGLQLLNEPAAKLWQPTLRRFYAQAYTAICQVARPGLCVVFSDAFTPRLMSGAIRPRPDFPVLMDHHWYHFFIWKHIQRYIPLKLYGWWLRSVKRPLIARLSRAQPVLIGEWNGIIGGEKLGRYPQAEHARIVRWHIEQQLEAFRPAAAWFYWSYKTEARGVYHFRSMVEDAELPLPKR